MILWLFIHYFGYGPSFIPHGYFLCIPLFPQSTKSQVQVSSLAFLVLCLWSFYSSILHCKVNRTEITYETTAPCSWVCVASIISFSSLINSFVNLHQSYEPLLCQFNRLPFKEITFQDCRTYRSPTRNWRYLNFQPNKTSCFYYFGRVTEFNCFTVSLRKEFLIDNCISFSSNFV